MFQFINVDALTSHPLFLSLQYGGQNVPPDKEKKYLSMCAVRNRVTKRRFAQIIYDKRGICMLFYVMPLAVCHLSCRTSTVLPMVLVSSFRSCEGPSFSGSEARHCETNFSAMELTFIRAFLSRFHSCMIHCNKRNCSIRREKIIWWGEKSFSGRT